MTCNFDPPEPQELCKHGVEVRYHCEKCDDEIDYDKLRDERKENDC